MASFNNKYILKKSKSSIWIKADASTIWHHITQVDVSLAKCPWYFKCLSIPKPTAVQVIKEGVGGYRVAYFDNGCRFHQEITAWDKGKAYDFRFNATSGFRVGYLFDLSKGPFTIQRGAYRLVAQAQGTWLELHSSYKVSRIINYGMGLIISYIMAKYSQHLLTSIKNNIHHELKNHFLYPNQSI